MTTCTYIKDPIQVVIYPLFTMARTEGIRIWVNSIMRYSFVTMETMINWRVKETLIMPIELTVAFDQCLYNSELFLITCFWTERNLSNSHSVRIRKKIRLNKAKNQTVMFLRYRLRNCSSNVCKRNNSEKLTIFNKTPKTVCRCLTTDKMCVRE